MDSALPATEAAKQWAGWGTALKPALEPITVARKPLTGTVAENVLQHGTGALNVDGCRVGDESGRFPANLTHDGSEEVVGLFPEDGEASAARFFYCAKADAAERRNSKHPTVKPVALMRYLVRLVCPAGGVVLDPFAGSGTTIEAARLEHCRAVGIEREAEYCADILERLRQGVLF
jgi:site-specific DNA-methyltransferase (adenine-specific)